jgi:hopanoid biosynthesis associated protein HpnK
MKQLVVNGDDFGLTESINQGILEAHQRGILTSTTLLANGMAFDSAVALALDAPRLGVGVHLNLTEGRPVSDASAVSSLVNDGGHFFGGPAGLARRILSGKLRLDQVEREWRAQIEKVQAAGIAVTHLDGHKHVHMLPAVFPIAVRLARHCGIPGVRSAVERPTSLGGLLRRHGSASTTIVKQYLEARALALAAMNSRERLQRAGLACPKYFYGITQTGFLDGAELDAILRNLPEGTSELMCHPGYVDGALKETRTRLLAQRERELEALTRPEALSLVAALGIELIDYRGLAGA